MSSCNVVLGKPIAECLMYAEQTDECIESWDAGYDDCIAEEDHGKEECAKEEDHGKDECSKKEDHGYNTCCTWKPCKWFCDAWVWVSNIVCVAWVWVSNVVCVAWVWVSNVVCVAWEWVSMVICVAWKWIMKTFCTIVGWFVDLVCMAWTPLFCFGKSLWSMTPWADAPPESPIKKLFVLVLENRSYDHMLGFANLNGRDPRTGAPAKAEDFFDSNGVQKNLDQAPFVNFRLDGSTAVSPDDKAPFMLSEAQRDPPHEFDNIMRAGAWDHVTPPGGSTPVWTPPSWDPATQPYPKWTGKGFVSVAEEQKSADPGVVMQAFSRNNVNVLAGLAEEYAVLDHWHASVPGATWPNRFFLHAASSGGLDDSPTKTATIGSVALDGYRFENGTVFDALDDECVDWRIFEGDEFPQSWAIDGMNTNAWKGRFTDMHEFEAEVSRKDFGPRYVFIEPDYGDILSGSYHCGNSQHPRDDVARGEQLIKRVYDAIRRSPHWETSALLITYDEHGGFFDHVEPPVAVPPGDKAYNLYKSAFEAPFRTNPSQSSRGFSFDRLGVRVPAVVVSPLIPRQTVDSTVYDHSSLVRTIGKIFGFSPLTKRDAAAEDFLHLFSLKTPRTDAPLQAPEPADSGITCSGFNPFDNDANLFGDLGAAADAGLNALSDKAKTMADPARTTDAVTGAVTGAATGAAGSLGGAEVPDSFWGFMQVAMRRGWSSARSGGQRRKLLRALRAVETETEARQFLLGARAIVARRRRTPLLFERYRVSGTDKAPVGKP